MSTAPGLLAFLAVTYVAAPLAVFVAAAQLMRPKRGEVLPLFLLMAPAAPFAIALVMMAIYSVPWRIPISWHIGMIASVILLALALGRHQLNALRLDICDICRTGPWRFSVPGVVMAAVVLGLLGLILFQALTMPVMENDSVEYLAVSREIFRAGTLDVYPLTKSTPSGMYGPSSHPPALHMLLIWGYSWFGVENFMPSRALAAFCVVGMISLLAAGLFRHGMLAIAGAVAIVLSTPAYVLLLVGYHVDGLRIMAVAGVIVAMARVIATPDVRTGVLAGIWLGCAAFSHSIGVLSWFLAALCWLVLGPPLRFRSLGVPLVIAAVAVMIGGAQYVKNIIIFGVPLHDHVPLLDLPVLRFHEDLAFMRGLGSLQDRLLAGPLFGFINPNLFGLSYWMGAVCLVIVLASWKSMATITKVAVLWLLLILSLALAGAVFNIILLIKNARYLPFTAIPAIAILFGSVLGQILQALYALPGLVPAASIISRARGILTSTARALRKAFVATLSFIRRMGRLALQGVSALVLAGAAVVAFLLKKPQILVRAKLTSEKGASAITSLPSRWPSIIGGAVLAALIGGTAFLASMWTIEQSTARLKLFGGQTDIFREGERVVYRRPGSNFYAARIFSYLEKSSGTNERTLTFYQPGTAIYGSGLWIDQYSDELIPFYQLDRLDAAHAWLRDRNVRYVFVPSFYLSTYSRSITERLMADERFSELVINDKGWQLFRLRDKPLQESFPCIELGPEAVFQQVSYRLGLVSRLAYAAARPEFIRYVEPQFAQFRIFGEDRPPGSDTVKFDSPYGRTFRLSTGEGHDWVKPGEEWLATSGIEGPIRVEITTRNSTGHFIIYVGDYGETTTGPYQQFNRVWDGILDGEDRKISFQFLPGAGSQKFRILIDKIRHAPATLSIASMKICRTPMSGAVQ
jgi:hypothetical protein